MTGNLDEAIRALLLSALPALFGGNTPQVQLAVQAGEFTLDPNSAEGLASEPRPDDRDDSFAFDPQNPPANFTLSQPP